jgi:hypothetical protein
MTPSTRRNVLLPWHAGLVVVVAADLTVAQRMFPKARLASGLARALVLVVMPVVHLVLMCLTLRSPG